MTINLALIGRNISQSRMPKLQMYLGELAGIDVRYHLHSADGIDDFSLLSAVDDFRSRSYSGLNITQPFKQDAWRLFHTTNNLGELGAFNTLTFQSDTLTGFNTDFSGFISAFKRRCGHANPGRVLQLGAGGVGRAIAFGLAELGVQELVIFDKNISQAEQLASDLPQIKTRILLSESDIQLAMGNVEGLVNCTPNGMYYSPESAFPKPLKHINLWAFDAVYTPLNTRFLMDCENANMTIISGFDLWIHQGVDAFKLFTNQTIEITEELLSDTLSWLD